MRRKLVVDVVIVLIYYALFVVLPINLWGAFCFGLIALYAFLVWW